MRPYVPDGTRRLLCFYELWGNPSFQKRQRPQTQTHDDWGFISEYIESS